jgi:hypothetical protein
MVHTVKILVLDDYYSRMYGQATYKRASVVFIIFTSLSMSNGLSLFPNMADSS